jgi:hypothetical protein
MELFKIIGIAGLVLICTAMVVRRRTLRDILSFFGGIGLLIYSIHLNDLIFTILQAVYVVVVAIDFMKEKRR